uniref:Uncharacterized protein n=1 Tax=Rheinheimera sp. BAL341 TaxID=1708203 RepID=A0A486XN25_9GAMM
MEPRFGRHRVSEPCRRHQGELLWRARAGVATGIVEQT